MKKILIVICIVIISSLPLIGCSSNSRVQFKNLFSEIIGFSKTESVPQKGAILMMSNEDYQKFKDTYGGLSDYDIPLKSPDKEKALLFLQIPSNINGVTKYKVKSLNISKNSLIINLKKSGVIAPKVPGGFNGTFKWVTVMEVDKRNLKEGMKIEIKK